MKFEQLVAGHVFALMNTPMDSARGFSDDPKERLYLIMCEIADFAEAVEDDGQVLEAALAFRDMLAP